MKLLVTRPMTEAAVAAISARFDARFRDTNTPLTLEEAGAALRDYDAIIPTLGDMFRAPAFQGDGIRTRILANFGAGYDHIDIAAAHAAGVQVTNTPDVVTDATADLALMLILMAGRRASEGERLLRAGDWTGWHPTQLLGRMVGGSRLGIVGMGRIGRAVAKRAINGLGMEVSFYNRSPVEGLPFPAQQVDSLDALLGQVDFALIAVPGGAGTRHLIGKDQLALLGPDGHLINIARGDVVDEEALITALEGGVIRSAALDVYEFEPIVPERLRVLENVTLLPHLGTAVEEVRTGMALRAFDNILALTEGRPLPDAIRP